MLGFSLAGSQLPQPKADAIVSVFSFKTLQTACQYRKYGMENCDANLIATGFTLYRPRPNIESGIVPEFLASPFGCSCSASSGR